MTIYASIFVWTEQGGAVFVVCDHDIAPNPTLGAKQAIPSKKEVMTIADWPSKNA